MDMQVANLMNDASIRMERAAELFMRAAQLNSDVQGMVAENDQRKIADNSMAYIEDDFQRVKDSYK